MNLLKSKLFIGFISFVIGVAAVLLAQKVFYKPSVMLLASNAPAPAPNMDALFDRFYDGDFFDHSRDPFEEMRKMREQMLTQFEEPEKGGEIFDSWYQKKFGGGDAGEIKKREDKDFVYYDITIKDLKKEDLKVKVADGLISVAGKTEKKSEEQGNQSYFSSSFSRSFPVPPSVNADKFQMEQMNNVVTLKFPKNISA